MIKAGSEKKATNRARVSSLKRDKGERIRTKNFAPVIRARGMRFAWSPCPRPNNCWLKFGGILSICTGAVKGNLNYRDRVRGGEKSRVNGNRLATGHDAPILRRCTLRDSSSILAKKDLVGGNLGMENGKSR